MSSPFEVVDKIKATMSVQRLCDALGVSRSSYYASRKRAPSARAVWEASLRTRVRAIHAEHRGRYGSPRIHAELKAQGVRVSRNRVERIMRVEGIRAKTRRPFKRTTDSEHRLPIAPNLLAQNFLASGPNQVWAGDITYVWCAEGWCYVAVLLDLYARKVIGWAVGRRMNRALPLRALRMAVTTRKPPRGLIHHTDRGSQYASHEYRAELNSVGARQSMSRAGNCWDNAVSETFFATLKKELIHMRTFATATEVYDALADYIDNYYNARRRHSTIGYAIPNELDRQAVVEAA